MRGSQLAARAEVGRSGSLRLYWPKAEAVEGKWEAAAAAWVSRKKLTTRMMKAIADPSCPLALSVLSSSMRLKSKIGPGGGLTRRAGGAADHDVESHMRLLLNRLPADRN